MLLTDFDYDLPEHLIALEPMSPRDHSRLLIVLRESRQIEHRKFFDVGNYLKKGDLLVLNNTKVLPARLHGVDEKGRKFECFLLKSTASDFSRWNCLVRPGKYVDSTKLLEFPGGGQGTVTKAKGGTFTVDISPGSEESLLDWLFENGETPLPPYIKRKATAKDKLGYQTVYASETGSVAAPTAGLHFTDLLLSQLRSQGVQTTELTLHIGYGTFSPIRSDRLEEHVMHEEWFTVPKTTFEKIRQTKAAGGRIIAVGTTALRALESMTPEGLTGNTQLFIRPGFQFQWVDGLITNFHLPKSSLYILICALLGRDRTLQCYQEAVSLSYRFFSYGDAMLIL